VINGATCHAKDLAGCTPVAQIPMAGPGASTGAIDHATRTLYASNGSGTVAVISTAACNATNTTGCAAAPPTINVGPDPGTPTINPATQSLYVPFGSKANRVAVINAATCNATDTSGCGQSPAVVTVGDGSPVLPSVLAVSTKTDTVYAPNQGPAFNGNTVSVINGATCNGTNHSGCGHLAATATVGLAPFGAAVNDRTHTLYVVNNADGDSSGTVSVINTATCNGTRTTGCHRRFPAAAVGISPLLAALDARTGTLYITDISSAQVTVLNAARCNARTTSGCRMASREQPVSSQPFGLAINPRTRTVYITNLFQAGSMSILAAIRH
jgi:DNA-binding beta-propeller fold protein YncE